MPSVDVKLDPSVHRAYKMGNDIAEDNTMSLYSVIISSEKIQGQDLDIITITQRSDNKTIIRVVLGGPKKPPIIG